jgi:hypothetical protein
MPNARKGADLGRDPGFALHSATVDPVEGSEAQWPGEAKISGRAVAADPPVFEALYGSDWKKASSSWTTRSGCSAGAK